MARKQFFYLNGVWRRVISFLAMIFLGLIYEDVSVEISLEGLLWQFMAGCGGFKLRLWLVFIARF
ncbi:hypothetical protein, partial [Candidatus Bartonella washoeensis]